MANIAQTGADGVVASAALATISPVFDAAPSANDLLIAWVYASAATAAISTPGGWTKIDEANGGSNAARVAMYVKVAAGADAAPTFTATGASFMAAELLRYVNEDTSTPQQTSGQATGTSATTLTAISGASVARSGCLALTAIGHRLSASGTDSETPGAGWASKNFRASASNHHYGVDVQLNPATGSTLAELVTVGAVTGTGFAILLVVFQPAAAGGAASGTNYVYLDGLTLQPKAWSD